MDLSGPIVAEIYRISKVVPDPRNICFLVDPTEWAQLAERFESAAGSTPAYPIVSMAFYGIEVRKR